MKTLNGYIIFDNLYELKTWLSSQKVSRSITRIQVHNTFLPDYTTWKNTDQKVYAPNPEIGRTKQMSDYGKQTWGSGAYDGYGHYIAQHFNVFPNGKITTGRNLNSTPIGIKGWNTNAICIEIYGNFDTNHDIITAEQKQAVLGLYALLAKKFSITINTTNVRPHCWFTASGTYLGYYSAGKSAKSCPGTNFWGHGCSQAGFDYFIKDLKAFDTSKITSSCVNGTKRITTTTKVPEITLTDKSTKKDYVKALQTALNNCYDCGLSVDGDYGTKTKAAVKAHYLKEGIKNTHVKWLQAALNKVGGYGLTVGGNFASYTLECVKKFQKDNNLTVDGYAGEGTHTAIINKLD